MSEEIVEKVEEVVDYQLVIDPANSVSIDEKLINYTRIIDINIKRGINEHTELRIVGNVINTATIKGKIGKEIKVGAFQVIGLGKTEDLLFAGRIENIEITGTTCTIEAKSFSIDMDKIKIKRSYQDIKKTYGEIIKSIKTEGKYEFNFIPLEKIEKKETGELLIQYEESDWEFLKRIASIFGTGLVMEDGKSERKEEESNKEESGKTEKNSEAENSENKKTASKKWSMWIGVEQKGSKELGKSTKITEVMNKYKEEYLKVSGVSKKYEIGDRIGIVTDKSNNSSSYYIVTESITEYNEKKAVLHSYKLVKEETLKISVRKRNENIAGKSIVAKVSEIGKGENLTRIRLDFIFENTTEKEKVREGWEKYWFRYSTPYSGTNSGMYIMPEKEDMVTVYFPNGYESNCYVGNSVREKNTLEEKDTDEAHKRIMIPTGQQVILSEKLNKVRILGNKDRSVYMDTASDHIEIIAGESKGVMKGEGITFEIGQSKIVMEKGKILIKCGSSEIALNAGGKVNVKGS